MTHTQSPDDAQAIRDGRMTAVLAVLDPQPSKDECVFSIVAGVRFSGGVKGDMLKVVASRGKNYFIKLPYTEGDTLTDEAGAPVARVAGSVVKPVQDVTEAEVIALGAYERHAVGDDPVADRWTFFKTSFRWPTPRDAFKEHFHATHGPDAWADNVFVQVARVELIEGEG